MRIVYTVLNGRLAGGQAVCLQTIKAARGAGYAASLVTPSRGEMTDSLEDISVPVLELPMERSFHIHRSWQFSRYLKKWKADLVHCHSFGSGCTLARIGSYFAGIPIVCHCHAHPNYNSNSLIRALQTRLDNSTAGRTKGLIAVSESVKAAYVRQGIPASKIRVLRNGVNLPSDSLSDSRTELLSELGLKIDEEIIIVGYVGRLSQQKGLSDLLIAAQEVLIQNAGVKILIIGEDHEKGGAYRRELESQVQKLKIAKKVIFLGYRADVGRLMQLFDVFVLPSWIEASPLTVLEAMAAGRPVVVTCVGGVPDIVEDGQTGIIVQPHAPSQLANALLYLLANPAQARRMGADARERVRTEFNANEVEEMVLGVYREIRQLSC